MYNSYGGVQGPAFDDVPKKRQLALGATHKSLNSVAIAFNFFVPWVLYCLISAMFSFQMHFDNPTACWVITIVLAIILSILIVLAFLNFVKRRLNRSPPHEYWGSFLYVTALLALVLGIKIGNFNYGVHMDDHYGLMALDTYTDLNPSSVKGQEVMDAGLVTFKEGSRVDVNRWIGFRNKATYCIAPITTLPVGTNQTEPWYDFFAVGKNCCLDDNVVFACAGDYAVSKINGGIRILNAVDSEFYKLAVQQLQAAYRIRTRDPLFFHVVEDPSETVHDLRLTAYGTYLIWMIAYFFFHMFLVLIATCFFAYG